MANSISPIVTVERVDSSLDSDALIEAGALEVPTEEWADPTYSFPVQGWLVGKGQAVSSVLVVDRYGQRLTMPARIPRPGIAAPASDSPLAANCGFAGRINAVELPRNFKLQLVALFEEGNRSRFAIIEGTRCELPAQTAAKYQPVMVTTLGRSGSTLLLSLLGKHPEITAFQPQTSEPRAASYFADVLRTLSRPTSYIAALRGYVVSTLDWMGASAARPLREYERDPELLAWMGTTLVEDLIAFVVQRLDAVYTQLSAWEGKDRATRFIEKCPPNGPQVMLSEIYPGAREIFLVRDFRDYVCSVRSWGEGWSEYRSMYSSEEQWVQHHLARQVRALSTYRRDRPHALVVRYEDLVTRMEETLESILAHLGVEAAPATVGTLIDRARTESDEAIERAHQTSGGVSGSIGRWKRELEPSLAKACEEAFGPALAEFGYA